MGDIFIVCVSPILSYLPKPANSIIWPIYHDTTYNLTPFTGSQDKYHQFKFTTAIVGL